MSPTRVPGLSVADAFIPCGMTVVRCAAASDGRINAAATTMACERCFMWGCLWVGL